MTNIPAPPGHSATLAKLATTAKQLRRAKEDRVTFMREARDAGIKWDPIAAALGISVPACIQLMSRAEGK